jgi:hypothetical protein
MQNLVTQIQALSQPKDWGHLVSTLDNEGALASLGGASAVGGILAQLNPQQHTVGFAVLLHVKTREDYGKGNFDGGMETMRQARPAPRPSSMHQMARLLLCMHESENSVTRACIAAAYLALSPRRGRMPYVARSWPPQRQPATCRNAQGTRRSTTW